MADDGETTIKIDYEERSISVRKDGLVRIHATYYFNSQRTSDIDDIVRALQSIKSDMLQEWADYEARCKKASK